MKIKLIALIFLINISIALAQVDINIYRDNYSSLETLQAEINLDNPTKNLSANDITIDNVKIAPFIFNLDKNKYFVYFDLLNLESKNHSLIVNSRFVIDNALTDLQKSKEFNVIDSDSSLSIKPAILFIDKNDIKQSYKITLKNNKDSNDILDVSVNLTSDFLYPARKILSFVRNEEKNLFIFTQQGVIEDSKIILTYDRVYEIPIIIKSTEEIQGSEETNVEEIEEKASFVTAESSLIRTLNTGQVISSSLEFKNNLDRNLDIKFYLTGNLDEVIRLKTTQITLSSNKEDSQTLFINEQKNAKGTYSGSLMLEADGYTEEFPIELTFVDEEETIIDEFNEENEENPDDFLEPIGEDFTPGVDLGILNFSEEQPTQEGKNSSLFSVMLTVIVVLLLLIIFYLMKIQKPRKNFKETISSIKK